MFIDAPAVNKNGKELGLHIINLKYVMYIREWVPNNDAAIVKGQTAIFFHNGKDIIIDLPLQEVYELMYGATLEEFPVHAAESEQGAEETVESEDKGA